MNRTLLDTDILSDFLRGQNGNVLRRAQAYLSEHSRLTLSAVTVFEVVRGRHQAQQIDRATQFLAWAQNAEVLAFDDKSARLGGELAGALLRTGATVGVADVLIAATAIANNLTLASANPAHYQRLVPFGLSIVHPSPRLDGGQFSSVGKGAQDGEKECFKSRYSHPPTILRNAWKGQRVSPDAERSRGPNFVAPRP